MADISEIEIETTLKIATRYMIDARYHTSMMVTFTKGGIAWTDELGAIADSVTKAGNKLQILFDKLTEVNNA